MKELANEKRKAYIRYCNNRTPEEHGRYKGIRNRINSAIKRNKKDYWEKFSKDMEHDLYGGQKKIWNILRNRKKPINEEINIISIKPETWILHFENLY